MAARRATAAQRPDLPTQGAPYTLAIDIGGTHVKASVLDAKGEMVAPKAQVPTHYPCSPKSLVDQVATLTIELPAFDRITAGFPGMVREGLVLSAPHFVSRQGPGGKPDKPLSAAWNRFDLAGALARAFRKPAKVANDADLQGAAVVKGTGLELVLTLGTGLGTALFYQGQLLPHLEFAHHPFRRDQSYNEQVGEKARKRLKNRHWSKRVHEAIETLRRLTFFDQCYLGGGNATKVKGTFEDDVVLVDNSAGILGGIKVWQLPG